MRFETQPVQGLVSPKVEVSRRQGHLLCVVAHRVVRHAGVAPTGRIIA